MEGEFILSGAVDGTAHRGGTTDLAHGDLQAQIGVDVNHDLDLGAGLDTLDGKLGYGLLGLPDNLADLLLLIIIGVKVRVLLLGGGLLLLSLGLGLGDLDLAATLADANQNITALLGGTVLGDATSGEGSLGVEEGLEAGLVVGCELNTDGLAQVRGHSDHGVDGLLDVLSVEFLDQRGLESGTTGGQFGGVDGGGGGGGSQNGGLLGEDVGGQLGDLRGVGGTAGEDNLEKQSD